MTDALETKRKLPMILRRAALCLLAAVMLVTFGACARDAAEDPVLPIEEGEAEQQLRSCLADSSVKEVTIEGTLYLAAPMEIPADKTIKGDGKITAAANWAGSDEGYLLVVKSGAEVVLGESLTVDANGRSGGVLVEKGGTLRVMDEAAVSNGAEKAANVYNAGSFFLEGGSLSGAKGHNLYVLSEATIAGGQITGSGEGYAGIYNAGSLEQSGGTVSGAYDNVYVEDKATFTWNAGENLDSVHDGISVAKGGELHVTAFDAKMKNAGAQGIYLAGTATIDNVFVTGSKENNVKVEADATLVVNDGIFDSSRGHGITNRGKLTINEGTVSNSKSCGIVNTGELEVISGMIYSNANKGILVKNGGKLTIASPDVSITGNKVGIAVEENAYADVSKAVISGNSLNNIACFGEIYLHDITMSSSGSNCIATNYGGHVIAKNMTIAGTLGNNGIYNVNGSLVELTDVTIKQTKTAAIRSLDADVIGNNVTIEACGNGISTGDYTFGEAGTIEINNLNMSGVKGTNVGSESYCGGTIKLTDAVLGTSGSNNCSIKGGHLILTNVDIQGNDLSQDGSTHGILLDEGGRITATNVTISGAKVSALRNRGGVFSGSGISIWNAGEIAISTALGPTNKTVGSTYISGLYTSGIGVNNILMSQDAYVSISNADLCAVPNNNVRVSKGTLVMQNVTINGHTEKNDGTVHSIFLTGGALEANNITVKNSAVAAIRNNGGTINATNVKISDAPYAVQASKGTVTLVGVTTENIGTNNISIDNNEGAVTIEKGTLCGTTTNNIRIYKGVVTLKDTDLTGHLPEANEEVHAVMLTGGELAVDNVVIHDSFRCGIRNRGGVISGKNLTLKNIGSTAISSTKENKVLGVVVLDGLVTENVGAENILADAGSVTVSNASLCVTKGANSVSIKGADVTLVDSKILGTSGSGTHGVYITSGSLTADGLDIQNAQSALRVNGKKAAVDVKNSNLANLRDSGLNMNNGSVKLTNVTIDTAKYGIYTIGGTVTGGGVTMDGITSNGICAGGSSTITVNGLSVNAPDSKGEQSAVASINVSLLDGSDAFTGTVTLTDAVLGVSDGNNVAVKGGLLNLNDAKILGSANHGVYVTTGKVCIDGLLIEDVQAGLRINNTKAVVDASNVTMTNLRDYGVNISGGTLTGKNIAIESAPESDDFYGINVGKTTGDVSITGLSINAPDADGNQAAMALTNVQIANGYAKTVTLEGTAEQDAVLGKTTTNGIRTYTGKLVLNHVDILGTTADNAICTTNEGVVEATDLEICSTSGSALRFKDSASFTGTNVSLYNIGTDGISNAGGTVEITNLQIGTDAKASSGAGGYGIDNAATVILHGTDNAITGTGSDAVHTYANTATTIEGGSITGSVSNEGTLTIGKTYVSGGVYTQSPIIYTGSESAHSAADPMLITVPEADVKAGTELVIFESNPIATALAECFTVPESYAEKIETSVDHPGILEVKESVLRLYRDVNPYVAVVNDGNKYKTLEEAVAYAATLDTSAAPATIKLIDDAYVSEIITVPANANIIITDDGDAARTIKRSSSGSWDKTARAPLFDVMAGATLTFQSSSNSNDSIMLTVDGNKASIAPTDGNWTLVDDFGTVKVGPGVAFQNSKSTGAGAAVRVESGASLDITGGKFLNNEAAGNAGGAVYVVSGAKDISVQHAVFADNAAGGHGGAICTPDKAVYNKLYINDCTFTRNMSGKDSTKDANGGAVSTYGEATIESCVFSGNSATYGGAINGGNGANITIKGCTFTGNTTTQNGGAVNGAGEATINVSGCIFTENSAAGNGGAASIAKGSIDGSTFTGNSTTASGGAINSNAAKAENFVVTNCTVTGNSADIGGGVYAKGSAYLTLDGCQVTDNTSTGGQGNNVQMAGTASNLLVKTTSQKTVLDIYFRNTSTLVIDGTLASGSEITCNWMVDMNRIPGKAITFDDANAAQANRQHIKLVDSLAETYHLEYTDGTDYRNYATLEQGKRIDVAIVNGVFYTDFVEAVNAAAAASVETNAPVTVKLIDDIELAKTYELPENANIIITDDGVARTIKRSANFDTTRGVMFDVTNANSTMTLSSTSNSNDNPRLILDGNNKDFYSGNCAIVVLRDTDTLNVNAGVKFTNNYSTGAGAVIRVETDDNNTWKVYLNINGGVFENNHAVGNAAGAINVQCKNTEIVIKNAVFKNNSADGAGGAIRLLSGTSTTVENCEFDSNTSKDQGGAIYVDGKLTVNDSTFTKNKGIDSGAIHASKTGEVTITGGSFTENEATAGYGGAASAWGGKIVATGVTFTKNTATKSGGALLDYKGGVSTLNVTDCKFIEISATNQGGAIAAWQRTTTVTNCEFSGNSAKEGGAIHMDNYATSKLVVSGGTFTSNQTSAGGGAIYINAKCSQAEISGAAFSKNIAAAEGGAICAGATVGVKISDCSFTENQATKGGAVTIPTGSYVIMNNVTCSGNTVSTEEGNDIRLGGATSKIELSGKIVTAVYNRNKSTVIVKGTLAEGSSLQADWFVNATDGRIPDVAVQFDDDATAQANMAYITVGKTCVDYGYALMINPNDTDAAVLYQSAAAASLLLDEPEQTQPAADPTEPAADPAEPAADPTEPAADPTEPVVDPTEPAVDPTEPAADPTEPAMEPATEPTVNAEEAQ